MPVDETAIVTWANMVTVGRVLASPFLFLMIPADGMGSWSAFVVWVVLCASDGVDGYLARRHGLTRSGAFLDPLADKALVVSTYLMLGWLGHVPGWLVVLVVFRDVLIIGGAMVAYLMLGDFHSRPLAISKLNTAVQIALVAAVLARLGVDIGHPSIDWVLVHVAAATTLASGFAYLWEWGRRLARAEGQQ